MLKQRDEIPVTYLNKGQAYCISIVDSNPPVSDLQQVRYRTHVRVSFHGEEERLRSVACWQHWKEGRGLNEAHQSGREPHAVEYVKPNRVVNDQGGRQIRLESSSLDGFCVSWSGNPTTGVSECAISVRFHFVSTDFTRTKGVQGVPLRLCVKTEMATSPSSHISSSRDAELCYCKVKLFRDHGAERKLSTDAAYARKTAEKLRQRIKEKRLGVGSHGKRKRGGGTVTSKAFRQFSTKVLKYERSLSMDSQGCCEEFWMLEDKLLSSSPASVLAWRGDRDDDPDLCPIRLSAPRNCLEDHYSSRQSDIGSNDVQRGSVGEASMSAGSLCDRLEGPWDDFDYQRSSYKSQEGMSLLDQPVKVTRAFTGSNAAMDFIEVVDLDPSYRPPVMQQRRSGEKLTKPEPASELTRCFSCLFLHQFYGVRSATGGLL
jgi:hypothetical protein